MSGGKEDESDDDFKPKRKAVPSGADEVADLIKKQVYYRSTGISARHECWAVIGATHEYRYNEYLVLHIQACIYTQQYILTTVRRE